MEPLEKGGTFSETSSKKKKKKDTIFRTPVLISCFIHYLVKDFRRMYILFIFLSDLKVYIFFCIHSYFHSLFNFPKIPRVFNHRKNQQLQKATTNPKHGNWTKLKAAYSHVVIQYFHCQQKAESSAIIFQSLSTEARLTCFVCNSSGAGLEMCGFGLWFFFWFVV